MKVIEVNRTQKMAAELLIELLEEQGRPVRDSTRRLAAARRRPQQDDPALEASDEVVYYLV